MDPTAVPNTPSAQVSLGDLVNLALNTAKAVEAVYPQNGNGAAKLEAVMALVNQFAPLASVAAQIIESVIPVFISAAVAEWNKIGAFLHPASPTAATPTA